MDTRLHTGRSYLLQFTCSGPAKTRGTAQTVVNVGNLNREPVVDPGGPYEGLQVRRFGLMVSLVRW
jgi:hypothetical protein